MIPGYTPPQPRKRATKPSRQPGPGTTYGEKLKDPRWQKRRLQVLERDDWTCQLCRSKDKTLHVHHRWYEKGAEPWEAPDEALVVLCEGCHTNEGGVRHEMEALLLEALRRSLFYYDIIQLADLFHRMPPAVIMALARGSSDVEQYKVVENWMRADYEDHLEDVRRLEAQVWDR